MSVVNDTSNTAMGSTLGSVGLKANNSLGSLLIGFLFSGILYGIMLVQTIIYFDKQSRRDSMVNKLVVLLLSILDTIQTAFLSCTVYIYLVTDFGDPNAVLRLLWSFTALQVVAVSGSFVIKICYIQRIWILSTRKRFLVIIPIVSVALTYGTSWAVGAECSRMTMVFQFSRIVWMLYVAFLGAIFSDLWIALSLCYLLYTSRTGFTASDKRINTLMLYIIHTGLSTSIYAIVVLVAYIISPRTYIFIGLYICYWKLILNAFLAMLNARGKLARGFDSSMSESKLDSIRRVDLPTVNPTTEKPSRMSRFRMLSSGRSHEAASSIDLSNVKISKSVTTSSDQIAVSDVAVNHHDGAQSLEAQHDD